MPAARVAAVAPPSQTSGREHGESRAWVHIGIGTGGEGLGVCTGDLRKVGIVRRQPVRMRLRERPISQRLGNGSRRARCVQLVARLAHVDLGG